MGHVVIAFLIVGALTLKHSLLLGRPLECLSAENFQTAIEAKAPYGDIEQLIQSLRICYPQKTELASQMESDFLKMGREKEFHSLKREIEAASLVSSVEVRSIEKFRSMGSLVGASEQEMGRVVSMATTRGAASMLNNKAKCSKRKDLRSQGPVEVRDQDSIGWCYAFAAADLLSYRTGKMVSASDIALTYNDTLVNWAQKRMYAGEQQFEGGKVTGALHKIIEKGKICLESEFGSEDNGWSEIYTVLEDVNRYKKDNSLSSRLACTVEVNGLVPGLPFEDVFNIVSETARPDVLMALRDRACREGPSLKGIQVREVTGLEASFHAIDQQLDRDNVVAISYLGRYLRDPNYRGPVVGHSSLVVGREFNEKTGECEYLIRNSWGSSCQYYSKSYRCENGHVWLPGSVLAKGLGYVHYLE